ncbi:MAG: maltose transport system substrate-binding protein [Bacteroidota bacterium]|nr:maltose transport system substrate-binding protein [Bacteroidota bacterium]
MVKIKLFRMILFVVGISIILPLINSCTKKEKVKIKIAIIGDFPGFRQDKALSLILDKFADSLDCNISIVSPGRLDSSGFDRVRTGENPDVFIFSSELASYFENTSHLSSQFSFKNGHTPSALELHGLNAMPIAFTGIGLYYNKSLMNSAGLDTAAPANYDELLSAVEDINSIDSLYGFAASMDNFAYKSILSMTENKELSSREIPGISQVSSAIVKYTDLARCGIVETQRQSEALFISGKVGFCFAGTGLIEKINRQNHTLNYGICPVPTAENSSQCPYCEVIYAGINKNSKNFGTAFKLLQILLSHSIDYTRTLRYHYIPAKKSDFLKSSSEHLKYEFFYNQLPSSYILSLSNNPSYPEIISRALRASLLSQEDPYFALQQSMRGVVGNH